MDEKMLLALRAYVGSTMSPKRFRHTAEVERMVERLAELYAPDCAYLLRAAALLHDITKELPLEKQLAICKDEGIELTREDILAPKTLHARTAAALIPRLYPEFADEKIISAVRWHTTGRPDMSICEKLVYLADYIDGSRTFEDCVRLREYFFSAEPEKMDAERRLSHLNDTLIISFDMTCRGIIDEGGIISADTFEARNYLIVEKRERVS